MSNSGLRSSVFKSIATTLTTTSVILVAWSYFPQKVTARGTQIGEETQNNIEEIETYQSRYRRCEYLTKIKSQLSSVTHDLEINYDILGRLKVLYEAGAVAELAYLYQRQDVAFLTAQQRKLRTITQKTEAQVDQAGCPFITNIGQYELRRKRRQYMPATSVYVVPLVTPTPRNDTN
ncbi:hypothetical protein [cf. Phormidesmis sp. LEGE 11477]|uniref:hypothetical protein n=1 Tax=cf. Phormidesmis sp. LEGE 11477 TaxID=1828680 RepID=UPI001881BB1A|nr:hypothetical protein [cf. Phormidesmis sp. LEGE 11477]MBE9063254.1 hypothetical protein [cf. Phormidesmis sp. LEGE 11477]